MITAPLNPSRRPFPDSIRALELDGQFRLTTAQNGAARYCAARKNRDADHLQNFVYDALAGIDADKLAAELLRAGKETVPEYAFDCHTLKGKRKGKTKAAFFREEQRALKPFQPGLFDDLAES